jgi:FdhD protein
MIPAPEPLPPLAQGRGSVFGRDGHARPNTRTWVPESPVALEYNGLTYAVMMATPADLTDFATGFALCEGLIARADQVEDIGIAALDIGHIVRASLAGMDAERLGERVRARAAESSCGLCGIENLEALAQPLPPVAPHGAIAPAAIFAALDALRPAQALGHATNAAHAAAYCAPDGTMLALREDVGRHNALSTARCSYEIVEKAVRAGATSLVTVSLPTSLAVARAQDAGLSLWVLARDDSVMQVATPQFSTP